MGESTHVGWWRDTGYGEYKKSRLVLGGGRGKGGACVPSRMLNYGIYKMIGLISLLCTVRLILILLTYLPTYLPTYFTYLCPLPPLNIRGSARVFV